MRKRTVAGVIVLYTALAIVYTWPQAIRLGTHVYDHIDPPFSAWRIGWVAHQLLRNPAQLFDANIFWPSRRVLAYSDAVFLEGVLAIPLIHSGLSILASSHVLLLAGFASSGFGAMLLARRLTGLLGPAILAGIVFAYAPYRLEHAMHLELQWAQWMPLTLWALHRALDTGRFRDGVLIGVFLTLQVLSSIYYAVFLLTVLAVVGPLLVLAHGVRRVSPAAALGAVSGVAMFALVAAAYMRPYQYVRQTLGERDSAEVRIYSATFRSFLATPGENFLYGRLTDRFGRSELRLFPGVTPTVLAAAAIVPPPGRLPLIYLAGLVVSVDGARGYNGMLFPLLRDHVPPFRGLRAPARFGIAVQLMLGTLAALGLARLYQSTGRPALLATAAIAITLIEYAGSPRPMRPVPSEAPTVYQWLADQPRLVTLELPVPETRALPGYDYLYTYFSTFHWQPILNGYSGNYGRPYVRMLGRMGSFPDGRSVEEMKRMGVQVVILHKDFYGAKAYEALVQQLDGHPAFGLIGAWKDGYDDASVYAFLPRNNPPAAPGSERR
jgi:hypothetical protein